MKSYPLKSAEETTPAGTVPGMLAMAGTFTEVSYMFRSSPVTAEKYPVRHSRASAGLNRNRERGW